MVASHPWYPDYSALRGGPARLAEISLCVSEISNTRAGNFAISMRLTGLENCDIACSDPRAYVLIQNGGVSSKF